MSFSPQLFRSNISAKEGLAKPSRFEVLLPIPPYIGKFIKSTFLEELRNLPNTFIADVTNLFSSSAGNDSQSRTDNAAITRYLSLQCENAELPGKSLITSDVKIYGPTFKVPYQVQFQETTLSFICTNEFYERKLFDRWIEAIMPSDTNNLRFPKGENSRYLTNIKIIQYDDLVRQIFAVELLDAFPISIASQPLSWAEENFHRLSIQFAYQKYKVIYDSQYDLVKAASSLFGTDFARFLDNKTRIELDTLGRIFR